LSLIFARERAVASSSAADEALLWESVAICPGVFLVVLTDADTEARRVAREIEATYAGEGGGAKAPPA